MERLETLQLKKYPVLVVDDEPGIVTALEDFLGEEFTLLRAKDAQEALAIIQNAKVAVVVSDQRMPGMCGAEFLGIVKEHHPEIGRVILSGYDDREDLLAAVRTGKVDAYVLKPWKDADLALVLKREICLYGFRYETAQLQRELESVKGKVVECEQQVYFVSADKEMLFDHVHIQEYDEDKIHGARQFMQELQDVCIGEFFGKDARPALSQDVEYVLTGWYDTLKTPKFVKGCISWALSPNRFSEEAQNISEQVFGLMKDRSYQREQLTQLLKEHIEDVEGAQRCAYKIFMRYGGERLNQLTLYTRECFGIIQDQGERVAFRIVSRDSRDFVIIPHERIREGGCITAQDHARGVWRDDRGEVVTPRGFCERFLHALRMESEALHGISLYKQYPVLLVDDDEANLKVLQAHLENEFTVLTACNGEDGLRCLQTQPVSVVVSDHVMPGMQGAEFLRKVMSLYPLTRRTILSAYDDKSHILPAINQALVSGYVVKPWNIDEFRVMLKKEVDIYLLSRELMHLRKTLHKFQGGVMHLRSVPAGLTSDENVYRDSLYVWDVEYGKFEAAYAFSSFLFEELVEEYYHSNRDQAKAEMVRGIEMAYTIYDAVLYHKYVVDKVRKQLIPADFDRFQWVQSEGTGIFLEDMVEDKWKEMIAADRDARFLADQMVGKSLSVEQVRVLLARKIEDQHKLELCLERLRSRENGRRMAIFLLYTDDTIVYIQHQVGKVIYQIVPREPIGYVLVPHTLLTEGDEIVGEQVGRYAFEWHYAQTNEPVTPQKFLMRILEHLRSKALPV